MTQIVGDTRVLTDAENCALDRRFIERNRHPSRRQGFHAIKRNEWKQERKRKQKNERRIESSPRARILHMSGNYHKE